MKPIPYFNYMKKTTNKILHSDEKLFPEQQEIKGIVCQAIKDHKMLHFYYESGSGKYWRKVEPYLFGKYKEGEKNLYFTGYAYAQEGQLRKNKIDNQREFLINKIDPNKFELLDETFNSLKVDYEKIYGNLPTVEVICRVEGFKKK
jgi:hypothetical protein